jgi:hypothetical protein
MWCHTPGISPLYHHLQDEPQQPQHIIEWYLLWENSVILNGPRRFVPQTVYQPHSQGDKERYVALATLNPPIIFRAHDSPEWGIPLGALLSKQPIRLLGGNEPAFTSVGPSVSIRVQVRSFLSKILPFYPWCRAHVVGAQLYLQSGLVTSLAINQSRRRTTALHVAQSTYPNFPSSSRNALSSLCRP